MHRADEPDAIPHDFPDLLHPSPTERLDHVRIERALDFAFASGGAESPLDDCLSFAKNVPSTWDPSSFERDVFLTELVGRIFPITIRGTTYTPSQPHLRALLAQPPSDPAITRFRQEVLRELTTTPELRKSLERLYEMITELRRLLSAPEMGEEPQINQRRIESLVAARDTTLILAEGFSNARSALSRLTRFGERVRSMPAFESLVSLLDFERSMAGVDVRLRIGHDGTLRSFDIVKIEENQQNPFYQTPLRRFWLRVTRFLRGYKVREDEVLEELIDGVFEPLRNELAKLFQLAGDLEFYLAGLGFADLARAKGHAVCLPEIVTRGTPGNQRPGETRSFEGLFNPLLLAEGAVPCSLVLDRHDAIVVLTGPNSGGKTRLLQTVAITQMLAQTGLFVPASSARVVWVEGLFVSLIEDAKADQREGRLGMELMRIREVFERLRPGGLVMLDELCAGTNPSEGEEIFELVVSLLSELEPQAFITTHFLDFADRLEKRAHGAVTEPGISLAFFQVELDAHDEPTYQFVPGVAKSSLAGKTAARLGVTRAELAQLVERSRRLAGLPAHRLPDAGATLEDTTEAAPVSGEPISEKQTPGTPITPDSDPPRRSMHGEGNAETADGGRPIGA